MKEIRVTQSSSRSNGMDDGLNESQPKFDTEHEKDDNNGCSFFIDAVVERNTSSVRRALQHKTELSIVVRKWKHFDSDR